MAASAPASLPAESAPLELAPAPPAPAAPSLRPGLSVLCTFHPGVPAVAKCRVCRKAVCETCAFKASMGTYCPDCATAPDLTRRKSAVSLGITSIVCGSLGLVLFVGAIVGAWVGGGGKDVEQRTGCLVLLAGALAIVGLIMGLVSRDPVRGRSLVGLIGLCISIFTLVIFGLLMGFGMMANKG